MSDSTGGADSLEWHSGAGGSGPTREERRKVWSGRFMVIWAGVGTLSFMTMIGSPTWLATWPSVVWVVHLLAMFVPIAVARVLRKSKPAIVHSGVSAIRGRTQLAWCALVVVWVPVNLIGNLVTTAWGLGDDVATAQTTHVLVRYKGDSQASYPVNGTVQTHSVRGFITRSTARHPQVVVFAREHPERVMILDQWRTARSGWATGAYLVVNGGLLLIYLVGTGRALRSIRFVPDGRR